MNVMNVVNICVIFVSYRCCVHHCRSSRLLSFSFSVVYKYHFERPHNISRYIAYFKKKKKKSSIWGGYGTPEGTFLFQYLLEKKLKQIELEKKSKQ